MKQIKNIAAIVLMSLFMVQFAVVTAFAEPADKNFSDVEMQSESEPETTTAVEMQSENEPAATTTIPATEGFVDDADLPDVTAVTSDSKVGAFDPTPPGGEATVIENEIQGNREFFTFKTPAGNVFYLVIERDKQSENVYFSTMLRSLI
jgi:hypothetical protein